MKKVTQGELRKRIEVELSKTYGLSIYPAHIKKFREDAAILATLKTVV